MTSCPGHLWTSSVIAYLPRFAPPVHAETRLLQMPTRHWKDFAHRRHWGCSVVGNSRRPRLMSAMPGPTPKRRHKTTTCWQGPRDCTHTVSIPQATLGNANHPIKMESLVPPVPQRQFRQMSQGHPAGRSKLGSWLKVPRTTPAELYKQSAPERILVDNSKVQEPLQAPVALVAD